MIFIILVAILGFFLYTLRPVLQDWIMDKTPEGMVGTSISVMYSVQYLFSLMASLMAGFIADIFGLFTAFYFIAILILLASLVIFLVPRDPDMPQNNQVSAKK